MEPTRTEARSLTSRIPSSAAYALCAVAVQVILRLIRGNPVDVGGLIGFAICFTLAMAVVTWLWDRIKDKQIVGKVPPRRPR